MEWRALSVVNFSARSSTFVAMIGVLLWLGAAIFFSVAVAPSVFRTVQPRAEAGAVVGQLLPVIFLAGIGMGLLATALEIRPPRAERWLVRLGAALLMVAGCGMAQFGIAPQIASVREKIAAAGVDSAAVALIQPVFGRLHMMSVAWLGVAMLAGASFVFFSWLAMRDERVESSAAVETLQ